MPPVLFNGYIIDCQKHVCFCKAPTGVCGHGAITGEYVNQPCHLNANVAQGAASGLRSKAATAQREAIQEGTLLATGGTEEDEDEDGDEMRWWLCAAKGEPYKLTEAYHPVPEVVIRTGTWVVDCRWFERMPGHASPDYEVYCSYNEAKVALHVCLMVEGLEWLPRETRATRAQVRYLSREWVGKLDEHWVAAYVQR